MATTTKLRRKDIRSVFGDPKAVDEELQDFRRSARRLSSNRHRLIERYSKQWVAVYDGKVKVRAKSFSSLLSLVDQKNLPRERVIIRYLQTTTHRSNIAQAIQICE